MTVDDLFEFLKYVAAKNQNGNITPQAFKRIINVAQRGYLASLLGDFASYRPGQPVARVELGNNATVRQRLSPVLRQTTITYAGQKVKFPADLLQVDAITTQTNKRVRLVEPDRLDSVVNSVIDPVAQNPAYTFDSGGVTFYPATTAVFNLYYVGNAPDIVWAYKPDSNGRAVYDKFNSKDPVWDDTAILDIAARALRMIGVSLSAPELSQYANEVKIQGQ